MKHGNALNSKGPASIDNVLDRLLETIALEELSLAAVINAEAEKVQTMVQTDSVGLFDAEDVVRLNMAVAHVLEIVVKKEDTLRKKLNSILAYKERRLT